ncbi:TRAP transporter small permease [Clostridium sp.]|uniref:TRAP transporter small permease n=1 Tax=Clostridium sp. TaxID=1506 RepID=UPI003EEE296E
MKKIIKNIQKVQLAIGVICISIFFIAIVVQVFCRYTGVTVTWTGEVSTYSFIWSVFMGAGAMTYEKKHFAFGSLGDKLTGRKKEILNIFISFVVMLFSAAILYYGIIITMKFWNYTWIDIPNIKMGYTWLCVPILGLTSIIYCIDHIKEYYENIKEGGAK